MKKGKIKGWEGIGPHLGEFVAASDAFAYVCKKIGIVVFEHTAPEAVEFKEMLIEWYFSGNWVEVYEEYHE